MGWASGAEKGYVVISSIPFEWEKVRQIEKTTRKRRLRSQLPLLASDITGPHLWVGGNDDSPGETVSRDGHGGKNISPTARVLTGEGGKRAARSWPLLFSTVLYSCFRLCR